MCNNNKRLLRYEQKTARCAFTTPRRHYFNSHAPCGARLEYASGVYSVSVFQLTRPLRGATLDFGGSNAFCRISTHTPLAGRDRSASSPPRSFRISTHTPLAGRDICRPHPTEHLIVKKKLIQSANEFIVNIELLNKLTVHIFRLVNLDSVNQSIEQSLSKLINIRILLD